MRYLFGAGNIAHRVLGRMELNGEIDTLDGIVVTTPQNNPNSIWDIPIKGLYELTYEDRKAQFILGVSDSYKSEIVETLQNEGVTDIVYPETAPLHYEEFVSVPKDTFLAVWYRCVTGRILDWNNLKTYNEKLQWIKLYDHSEKKRDLADKYLVRKYVGERIGEKYLIPLLGVWSDFSSIEFQTLPERFVLKCNHGSGWNKIVNEKSQLNIHEIKSKFDRWLRTDYYDEYGLEMQYKGIKPLIIAEQLLEDDDQELRDYKFFVFHNQVKMIQVDIDRKTNHRRNLYTPEWEYLPYSIHYPTAPDIQIEKPRKLEEMKELAIKLTEGFIHARIDLYYSNNKIYFGEITFTHGSGAENFTPYDFGYEMGNWLKLPFEGAPVRRLKYSRVKVPARQSLTSNRYIALEPKP